jgi:hypothetical protein
MLILPPEKESKIGSKEPENRQNLIFASGSKGQSLRVSIGSTTYDNKMGQRKTKKTMNLK